MALRGGRYEILGTIASGGMATVHLGRALGAGGFERLVAVKTMHPHLAREAEFVAMFLDEARLAARIRHPNVVATLDIQQDAEGLFLVMEYVEGPSLSRLLRALAGKGDRMPIDVALRIFTDTLSGLHAAHELTGPEGEPLHLIHRDMSPHNVLVGADGIARITDFGVARAESRLATTRTGSVKGKVTYMAPEQVLSQPLDRRVDIYAAGAVLWEMLTGERLVRAESDLAAMHMIMESERRSPHEVSSSVPEAISGATMRALSRDPEGRYPTAAAFAEAIEAAAAASGVAIAAPRAVAQTIRALGVHQPPEIAPASRRPAGEASAPGASSSPSAPSAASIASSASVASAASVADASSLATRADATPASVGTHAAFEAQADAADSPPPARRGAGVVLGVVGAALLGATVAVVVVTGRPKASGEAPAAPGGSGLAALPDAPGTDGVPSPAVVPAEAQPSSSATATADAAASAAPGPAASSAAAGGNSGPAAGGHTAPTTGSAQRPAVAPARPAATAPAPTAGPKAFRPKEL